MLKINILPPRYLKLTSSKYLLFLCATVTILVYGFLFRVSPCEAVTENYFVTGGADFTSGAESLFSENEISRVASSDDGTRLTSELSWNKEGKYNEDQYIEFNFSPNIPSDAIIDNVILNHEFRRSGALDGVKIEVWDGASFVDYEINTGIIGEDYIEYINITSAINTADKINNTKIRFLAYRSGEADTTTGHDFIGLTIDYHLPEVVVEPPKEEVEIILIENDITENTTWNKENIYVVTQPIIVKEDVTLTIESGVIVKFKEQSSFLIDGSIKVGEESSDLVVFTSFLDDTEGGDTNDDGSSSLPSVGDWNFFMIESPSIPSVLDNISIKYSKNGIIIFDSPISSKNLNTDQKILLFGSESNFENLKAESLVLFDGSIVEAINIDLHNTIFIEPKYFPMRVFGGENSLIDEELNNEEEEMDMSYYPEDIFMSQSSFYPLNQSDKNKSWITSGDPNSLSLHDKSFATVRDSNIMSSLRNYSAVNLTGESTLFLDKTYISNDKNIGSSVLVSDKSFLDIKNSRISNVSYGPNVENASSLNINNSTIICSIECVDIDTTSILSISNSKISGASGYGIGVYSRSYSEEFTISPSVVLNNNEIFDNKYGIYILSSVPVTATNNIIYNNQFGVYQDIYNYDEVEVSPHILNFKNNYWGDETGPKNLILNPNGLGNEIFNEVDFIPFLTSDPREVGLSNVMFIPGFQASRLYDMVGDGENGTEFEKRLWEPGVIDGISDMYMNSDGESINKNIYTRDVIDEAVVFGLNTLNFYKLFMGELDNMVSDGEINGWKPIAYDWRLSQTDIVNRGIEKTNGDISYLEELNAGQVPYIIGELKKLSDSSKSGKVTIVTHSNGGLVAKALISKLLEMKNSGESDLIDKIDNLIEVAPPLVGTPKAIMGVLHGYDQGIFRNILLGRKKARDFGLNVAGAYGLIPSDKYISEIENDQILLDISLDNINNWRGKYGDSIDTYEELENFLIDIDKIRNQADYNDLVNPAILNKKILDKAKVVHDGIDDLIIPDTIQVHQVIGWGLPTPYSMGYKSKNECLLFSDFLCSKKKFVLSSDINFTSGGDGTVVGSSASFGDGKEYYLNLKNYNDKPNIKNRDHVDIFEISYVFDLIHNILKSDTTLPEYVTLSAPNLVNYTVLKMRSPVSMDIYDKDNNHTGPDEEGIPNSLYVEFGDDKYLVFPSDGEYTLKLTGLSDGIFTLEQEQISNGSHGETVVFKDIPTTSFLRGSVDIQGGALMETISIDKDNDGIFEDIVKPEIAQDLIAKEEIETKKSYGGYTNSLALNISLPKEISNEEKNIENKIIIKNNVNTTKNITQDKKIFREDTEEKINDDNGPSLSASAGLVQDQNAIRFKIQLIIIGSFILLLLSLKFIFKVI